MSEYFKFFNKVFFLAILLILLGFIIDAELAGVIHAWVKYISIISDVIKNIGVALLVGNIFSFIIGTKEFIDFIKKKLQEIVLSNEFVSDLDEKEKIKLTRLTLGPKSEITKIYSGIERYFDNYLRDSLRLFTLIFRGKVSIDVKAKFSGDGIVFFDERIEYRSFRVDKKMEKLKYSFEDDRSRHIKTSITTPEGENYELAATDEQENNDLKDASMKIKKIQSIPDELVKHEYLDIERHFIEYGEDHWGVFSYKASQPSDGLKIKLECYDGLTIKTVNTYGMLANFSIEPSNPKGEKEVVITCKNWLTPGFGVSVIVSKTEI